MWRHLTNHQIVYHTINRTLSLIIYIFLFVFVCERRGSYFNCGYMSIFRNNQIPIFKVYIILLCILTVRCSSKSAFSSNRQGTAFHNINKAFARCRIPQLNRVSVQIQGKLICAERNVFAGFNNVFQQDNFIVCFGSLNRF